MATAYTSETETNGRQRTEGVVTQIIGVVIDATFPPDQLPEIYNAIEIPLTPEAAEEHAEGEPEGERQVLVCEVQQHLGNDIVRAVAMSTTDGLRRGMQVIRYRRADLGAGWRRNARPRVQRYWAMPIDNKGPVGDQGASLDPPAGADCSRTRARQVEILETGIKVLDLIAPFTKGGKAAHLRRRRHRQDGGDPGADRQHRQDAPGCRCLPAWASARAKATT